VSDEFEFRLERMFADAPAMADAPLFTARVMEKLDRGWAARRVLIGGMGAVGGLVAAVQVLGGGAIGHLHALGVQSSAFLNQHLDEVVPAQLAPGGFGLDVQTLMMIGALAVAAAGFGLVRLIREI
jgi:hypothetical protein